MNVIIIIASSCDYPTCVGRTLMEQLFAVKLQWMVKVKEIVTTGLYRGICQMHNYNVVADV